MFQLKNVQSRIILVIKSHKNILKVSSLETLDALILFSWTSFTKSMRTPFNFLSDQAHMVISMFIFFNQHHCYFHFESLFPKKAWPVSWISLSLQG